MKRNAKKIREIVKKGYAKIAKEQGTCCSHKTCCSESDQAKTISKSMGYSNEEMRSVPDGANLGLGCGNPVAIASLKRGEVVLDLGSGAGFDAFLAARTIGKTGYVIGVDMTPEMIKKAEDNAQKSGFENVEFRLGEIEKLPVEDNSIDIVISNCVINLSPDKERVFKEIFRVLKPGGRIMISDLILVKELPEKIRKSVEFYVGCLAGAVMEKDYINFILQAGFKKPAVISRVSFPIEAISNDSMAQALCSREDINDKDLEEIKDAVISIKISAFKSSITGGGKGR
ncbi:arsenite methyltransferase [bacterium]|nr:arsenite methyltransferase [bacterium]